MRNVAGLAAKTSLREIGSLSHAPISLDRRGCSLSIRGRHIQLSSVSFEILWALARHPGHVVEKSALCDVRGRPVTKRDVSRLYTSVRRLRDALGPDRDLIASVRGGGYRMNLDWRPR